MKRGFISIVLLLFIAIPNVLYAQKNNVTGAMFSTTVVVQKETKEKPKREKKEKKEKTPDNRKGRFFVDYSIAMSRMKGPNNFSHGFMVGWGSNKVVGAYAKGVFGRKLRTDTHGTFVSTESCLGSFWKHLSNENDKYMRAKYSAFTGGVLFRLKCPLNIYAGAGTSWRKVIYANAIDGKAYIATDKSVPQVCVDMGLMWRAKWFNVAAGTIYTPKFGFAGNLSFGVCF